MACPMRDVCPIRDAWVEVKEAVERMLERTTLRDLVERKRWKADSPASKDYR
jgi:DNA-binding IscR family transcriptional regulator